MGRTNDYLGVNSIRLNTVFGRGVPVNVIRELDVKLEYDAIERLRSGIALCRDERDEVSRDMLEHILTSEEEHTDWLETQLELIRQVGEQLYCAQQIHD